MKKILAIVAIATIALIGCQNPSPAPTPEPPKNEPWDMDAKISLRPAAGVKADENPEHLSAKEIVKQATDMWFSYDGKRWGRGFADAQRDTVAPRLMMWASDIIMNGEYLPDFIESSDLLITIADYNLDVITDTIAYIPNSILRTAQPLIKTAFEVKDYEACYALFDEAFTFIPITGEEWLELQAQGKN